MLNCPLKRDSQSVVAKLQKSLHKVVMITGDYLKTAIAIAKRSFNAATENLRGISSMGMQALALYYDTDESREGVNAFMEKRNPEFRRFVK